MGGRGRDEGLLDRFRVERSDGAEAYAISGVAAAVGVREVGGVDIASQGQGLKRVAGMNLETEVLGSPEVIYYVEQGLIIRCRRVDGLGRCEGQRGGDVGATAEEIVEHAEEVEIGATIERRLVGVSDVGSHGDAESFPSGLRLVEVMRKVHCNSSHLRTTEVLSMCARVKARLARLG